MSENISLNAQFSQAEQAFMQRALDLAAEGCFTTSPNPMVGCVLVKNGQIVGEGFHHRAGEGHAEVMALRMAGEQAHGATAFVTLEPCSHYGRTPPCALALINAGVAEVIAAQKDPNPQVAGRGLAMLRKAGIKTRVGLMESEAEWLNRAFLKRMRTGLSWVTLKMAMSLDGRTALANGESKWITNAQSRADVQRLRAESSAILSTSATVLADDPQLNVRFEQLPFESQAIYCAVDAPNPVQIRQPVRVILDNHHKVTPQARLFNTNAPVWLVSHQVRDLTGFPSFCKALQVPLKNGQTDLKALLKILGEQQINSLWIEAGATLAGAFVAEQLVDELWVYIAPKLLGDSARGLCKLPHLNVLDQAFQWQLQDSLTLNSDLRLHYLPMLNTDTNKEK